MARDRVGMTAEAQPSWIRRSVRVIRMVSELHRMGYQRARIMPFEYPLAYRVYIGPAEIFSARNYAYFEATEDECYAGYSSASDNHYFDWPDATADSARALADKFVQRFPAIISRCAGGDWAYAGWLADLLGVLEKNPGRLPIVMSEFMDPAGEALHQLPLRQYGSCAYDDGTREMTFDLPPAPRT